MIAHLDIDAFFAAVELHRHPEHRRAPLVVGGDPEGRGVVATASYAARRFGIHSAMSCAEARRRCPDAVFIRPDIARYRRWSARVWEVLGQAVEAVEVVGLDEGYLEVGADDPEASAHRLQQLVRTRMRLSCSVGVSRAKVVAKVASDHRKPGGITVVPAGAEADFLAPLPLRALPGIGPRTEERLRAAGLSRIGDLAALAEGHELVTGAWGSQIHDRARGIDPRPVESVPAERLSVSAERTFSEDISDPLELGRRGMEMASRVAERLVERRRAGSTVTVKLRFPDFSTITRSETLGAPTAEAEEIWAVAARLLDAALEQRPEPLRLLGVGVSGFDRPRQLVLFDSAGRPARTAPPGGGA